jgi:UDP-N-acetylmuramoyl-L-alanyl-D-glutamate--2,6-diaminopimelate ligase
MCDVVGFTNLARDHLDFHKTLDAYYEVKRSIFSPNYAQRGVVVIDDEWGERLAVESLIDVQTVSMRGRDADWTVTAPDVTVARISHGSHTFDIEVALPGEHNVINAALAFVMAQCMGISADDARTGIASVTSVPGRMQLVWPLPYAYVDFAHTPYSIEAVLRAARAQVSARAQASGSAQASGRVLVAFGCGGGRDQGKRFDMGLAAARGADIVIITDDNPRDEDPAEIRAQAMEGARFGKCQELFEIADRAEAITTLVALSKKNDVLLVLGKGHETTQIYGTTSTPCHDAEILESAMRARWS